MFLFQVGKMPKQVRHDVFWLLLHRLQFSMKQKKTAIMTIDFE